MKEKKVFYLDEIENIGIVRLKATPEVRVLTPRSLAELDSQELDGVASMERILVLGPNAWTKMAASTTFVNHVDLVNLIEDVKRGYVANVLGYQVHVKYDADPDLVSLTLLYVNRDNRYEVLGFAAFKAE